MAKVLKAVVLAGLITALMATAAYAAVLYGTSGDDTITGTDQIDSIYGYGGKDTLYGKGGTDNLLGGKGNDTLYGGPLQDTLRGQAGDDHLYGGPDGTKGPFRTDQYFCGAGEDTVHLENGENAPHNFNPACEHIVHGSEDSE